MSTINFRLLYRAYKSSIKAWLPLNWKLKLFALLLNTEMAMVKVKTAENIISHQQHTDPTVCTEKTQVSC